MEHTFWLVDRSRYEQGVAKCRRQRYLRYHAGTTGYGLVHHSDALPLSTGAAVHHVLERLAKAAQGQAHPPTGVDRPFARQVAREAVEAYQDRVRARGYTNMLDSEIVRETAREQASMVEGFTWLLALHVLPAILKHWTLLEVEEEHLYLLPGTCTCQAGPLPVDQHAARGCEAVALMLRTDLLCRHRESRNLAYIECKTTGYMGDAWTEKWESKAQLALGTLGVDARHGQPVTELYIVGLGKGRRTKDKSHPNEMKRQNSPLCYGYCKPANPPLEREAWLPAHEWWEGTVKKRAPGVFKRRGLWTLTDSWAVLAAARQVDPHCTPMEVWVEMLPQGVLDNLMALIGPWNLQTWQLESTVRSMRAEEMRWRRDLWAVYEVAQAGQDTTPTLDALFPCSWDCRPFGADHACEFIPLCFHHNGWDQPDLLSFEPRKPHHQPEIDQAVARGLAPESWAEEGEDES